MVCPYCQHDLQVINSRPQKRTNSVWRRRHCMGCGATLTSIERLDLEKSVVVSKRGNFEPFLRDKLFVSLYESLKHRNTALVDASALTNTAIGLVLLTNSSGTVAINELIKEVERILSRFDAAAASHYRAFHPPHQG